MSLQDVLLADKKAASKAGRRSESDLLGVVLGNISTKESRFNPRRVLSEGEVVDEVRAVLKGVEVTLDALASASDTSRQATVATLQAERALLQRYMPAKIDEEQIRAYARTAKADGHDMKFVMTALKLQFPGAYDGSTASRVVKEVMAGG